MLGKYCWFIPKICSLVLIFADMNIILGDGHVRLLGIEVYDGVYVSEFMGIPLIIEMERLGKYSWVLPD